MPGGNSYKLKLYSNIVFRVSRKVILDAILIKCTPIPARLSSVLGLIKIISTTYPRSHEPLMRRKGVCSPSINNNAGGLFVT